MEPPEILDNLTEETQHGTALRFLAGEEHAGRDLAVATGYVDLAGLHALAGLAEGRGTRLLIGAEPAPGLGATVPLSLFGRHVERLRAERDLSRFPPSRAARTLRAVSAWLDRPDVQVRRFTTQFLHGKTYLLGAPQPRAVLVTSANLTGAGLHRNLELGVVHYQPGVATSALAWYDALWAQASDFEDELRELLFPDPGLLDPETIYLRALLELQDPEETAGEPRATAPEIELAPFQRDGYERARAIANRRGGVVYADGVGTGKTEIGLAFIEERTNEDGVYALVVTPAQLRGRWEERIQQVKLPAQVISFQELATDEQLIPSAANARRILHLQKDAYRLVLVDEGHALRNADTTWYRAMERLLGGAAKQLVLLSATPINNGLWDLYNLVMLFARHDRAFAAEGIDSIRGLFLQAGASERDPEALSPERLFPLADAVSVRRDRRFIAKEYPGQQFPDGTPVRFPEPRLETLRYDLDTAHPGLVARVAAGIDALTMARYRSSAYLRSGDEDAAEVRLGGLVKSGVLKRFESCWWACLRTVGHMLQGHDAFLTGWEEGTVPSRETLRRAAREELEESGMAGWVAERLEGDEGSRPVADFDPAFAADVRADRAILASLRDELAALAPGADPKLAALVAVLEASPAEKVAVFASFGDTVSYLDEHLPATVAGRDRVVVVGGDTTPDERTRMLSRFTPDTVVREGYEPPGGEVAMLLSTDVLSEGQNLQQAQAVVSYDMPWNPQRVVQRNGRVIRLRSPHDEVLLTTMLPEPGELEELLQLEARIQAKVAAAGVYGMESEVIEGRLEQELRAYADRVSGGDATLLDEAEEESGAFVGEELRRILDRALREGELDRVRRLPWGVGAAFRQTGTGRSHGRPGVFFAVRTPAGHDDAQVWRYWRYVETGAAAAGPDAPGAPAVLDDVLTILRRIDPDGGAALEGVVGDADLERAWELAAASILAEHNARTDLHAVEESIGPAQRWALETLRDPDVPLVPGADEAADALEVGRSSAVRRDLGEIRTRVAEGGLAIDAAVAEIVSVVADYGLRAVTPPPLPQVLTEDDLGVVCWMAVLPPG